MKIVVATKIFSRKLDSVIPSLDLATASKAGSVLNRGLRYHRMTAAFLMLQELHPF
jgi:hypothetical protein